MLQGATPESEAGLQGLVAERNEVRLGHESDDEHKRQSHLRFARQKENVRGTCHLRRANT